MDAVCDPDEMDLPDCHCHAPKDDREDQYAVTIRAKWRIVFEWDGEHAVRVRQEDYHGD
ncbi:MAG TPA: hypothetical protein VFM24_07630 [Nitrospira sp.]|nr:hypothetical protein [Nitrospira sp.]